MKDPQPPKVKNPKKFPKGQGSKGLHDFARYSGLAFQMITIIVVMTWIGIKLDKVLGFENPVFTVIFSLLGVFAGIYTAIKDFLK
jgi:ATP synthase protein I